MHVHPSQVALGTPGVGIAIIGLGLGIYATGMGVNFLATGDPTGASGAFS